MDHSVLEYDVMKGHLLVEHAYPTDTEPTPKALIDVNIILGTIKGAMLETGSWINVIGYVKGRQQTQKVTTGKSLEANLPRMSGEVLVQAVLVWDAGAMQINEYEKTMEAQREAWRKMKHVHDATRVGRSL